MDNLALLKQVSFGARVAEDETSELASYFVETDQWNRIFKGEIDIIRGEKGAGKSAIYSLLMAKESELFDKSILLAAAETPRGATVFKDLVADPPTSEVEFIGLWKIYIVAIIAQRLRDFSVKNADSEKLFTILEDAKLLEPEFDLHRLLRLTQQYVRGWIKPESVELVLKVDPHSGLPTGFSGKITPSEPSNQLREKGYVSVDNLIAIANCALNKARLQLWVLLDRLDVAFIETHDLERNALRALFRVYRDISGHDNIKLKIFLRSDIWKRIVDEGFREASHITKYVTLEWSPPSLLNLMIRRILNNSPIVETYRLEQAKVLSDFSEQQAVFYKLFPPQVEQGSRKPSTLDWMISRCADGTGNTAPREIIHLLTSLREQEIARLERGEGKPPEDQLFDRSVFKLALPAVSEARLVQNLYAEYPELQPFISKLSGEKTEQTPESLSVLWKLDIPDALAKAQKAIEIGFFQIRGSRAEPTFWVPFIYRDALKMSQGLAEE